MAQMQGDLSPAVLARTKLFGGLDVALLVALRAAMHEVHFDSGQLIFSRGDSAKSIYVVLEGQVRISVLTADGRELCFTHVLAGEVFGEIAVLDRSARSANATALTDVKVLSLSATDTDRFLVKYPALARAFMTFLCARLREVSDHLENGALLPIEARVARYILDRLMGNTEPAKTNGKRCVSLGISQTELALLLGASRPKVNMALSALEDCGAIRRIGKGIECDGDLLAEMAQR